MAGTQPVAIYALRIPPGDILVPAVPDLPAMLRVTMAAIDPSQEPELDVSDDKQKPRATLKVVRIPEHMLADDDDSEEDEDDEDDEEDSELDESNGGPSAKKSKKAITGDDDDDDDMDAESDDDEEEAAAAQALLAQVMKADKKGKSKALDGDDDDDDDDLDGLIEDASDESLELDEAVICTLDPDRVCQQPLDFHVAEGERVFFKVSGNFSVHLTGNYVMPLDEPSDDDYDEDYDLSPDEEDELDGLDALVDGDDESDELDDLEDPRVMEVDSDEEEKKAKKAIAAAINGKGKNKRPAEDDEEASLDSIMAKSLKKAEGAPAITAESKPLTKAEKKAAKKLKNNEGQAATPPQPEKKESTQTNGESAKKVQFAKNLEQGPTPSKADKPADKKAASLGVKDVQGVTIDDRKAGTGPQAKKGSRLELRYIGKLDDGKVFDSNKSGKPFSLKLGAGDVIKGWDIGLQGIASGGERRMIIPAHLAYGKKALPGIPANSKLTFDVKCLSVK